MNSLFEEFGDRFEPIYKRVERYFQGRTNDPGEGDAADRMQELFMRICEQKRSKGLKIIKEPEKWVFRVAHNILVNQQKNLRDMPQGLL